MEAHSLRLSIAFGLAATIFALIPFFFALIFDYETVIWRLASLLLVLFLGTEMTQMAHYLARFGALQPRMGFLLLVFSGILLTIELINMLWWGAREGYAPGLLGILILSGSQFIMFVSYDRTKSNQTPYRPKTIGPKHHADDVPRRADAGGGQLQRHNATNYPHRTATNHQPKPGAQPNADANARRQRYGHRLAFTRTRDGDGWTVAHPVTRPDEDTRR
jgi:hypothetical protein